MIEINNLNKIFNRFKKNKIHVIKNTSLKLPDKGLVSLLGPSGSGKTTTLNLIGGLDKATSGNIKINNNLLSKRNSLKRDELRTLNIGYIFQDYKLIDQESVFDNVAISLKLIGVKNKEEIKKRVEYILNKVDLYRYRHRPAGMLSGGERQRVGIARAIVKNPDIILADEPTGNLDSKNTIEVMNIIKEISKEKLVILVTHEQNLAKFYSDKIIEFEDGIIKKDYLNDHAEELDYQIENKFYLKDFKYNRNLNIKNTNINIYSNEDEEIKIDIVIKNGNYYIKTYDNKLTEIVDDSSSVEFINDHYKKINRNDIQNNQFKLENISKKKYTSIYNIASYIKKGFKKVFNYSFIKKLLLGGFLLSGAFILYAISSYSAVKNIKDEQFIVSSRDYIKIKMDKIKVSKYKEIEKLDENATLYPGDANGSFRISLDKLFQFNTANISIKGNLVPYDKLKEKDILYGRLPENENEVVIDKLLLEKNIVETKESKMVGLIKPKDYLNLNLEVSGLEEFKIVGISNKVEPCIYMNKDLILHALISSANEEEYSEEQLISYSLYKNKVKVVKGRKPINDYEIIVNKEFKYDYPLNKKISKKINKHKLKVVGYYKSNDYETRFISNDNTIKYDYILKSKDIMVFNGNIDTYKDNNISAYNTYDLSKEVYKDLSEESIKSKLTISIIIISISLIEAFLISRSSFLSKIKEVGTLRAIGVKKKDIYKIFIGESFAITTISSVPGILLSSYIINKIISIRHFKYDFIINYKVVLISIVIVYIFNILVSLLPVFNLIRKTPASILSRNDIE